MNRQQLTKKMKASVDTMVYEKGYVSMVDVLLRLNKLQEKDYVAWRKRKVTDLEKVTQGSLGQLSFLLKQFRSYCTSLNLKPSWTGYNSWGKGKKVRLRFSKSGNPHIEKAYATHYVLKK